MSVYGALLARPGARALACACALGWLSFGGLMLGIVLAAERASGSFATAGAAAGAFAAASALLAPLRGRLVDRRGPTVLLACALVHAAALGAFAWVVAVAAAGSAAAAGGAAAGGAGAAAAAPAGAGAAAGGAGATVLLIACAAAAGASAPPLIAMARALWPRVAGPQLTRAGHALNALLGDVGGVAGPALAALLVTVATPAAAPAALALGPLAGALLLARVASRLPPAPRAAPAPHPRPLHLCLPHRPRPPRRSRAAPQPRSHPTSVIQESLRDRSMTQLRGERGVDAPGAGWCAGTGGCRRCWRPISSPGWRSGRPRCSPRRRPPPWARRSSPRSR